MTNTGVVPAGGSRTFYRSAYDESPARCWRPSPFVLSARAKPRIKGVYLYLYLYT